MDVKDTEKLMESFKKRPGGTISAIVILLLLLSVIAFFTNFFGEEGKRAAGSSKEAPHIEQSTKDLEHERKNAGPRPTINQHTEGNQAPAVNVSPGGTVNINYGSEKNRNSKE